MVKGLMIIPEGLRDKTCKDVGYPYELTRIPHLESMLGYASYHSLSVVYFYSALGICFADDVNEYSTIRLSKLSKNKFKIWYCIMANQILDLCVKFNVNQIYLMVKSVNKYSQLIKGLEHDGIKVNLPIVGMSDKLAGEVLSRYMEEKC